MRMAQSEVAPEAVLDELRREIEEVDRRLVELTARRCHLASEVGAWKRSHGSPVIDSAQEARVVRRAVEQARAIALDEGGVEALFLCLIGLARGVQARPPSATGR